MKESIMGRYLKIKASGGIRTLEDADAMIEAGADRIGASALFKNN
jgi:deoxyribose-phosphate aldolase